MEENKLALSINKVGIIKSAREVRIVPMDNKPKEAIALENHKIRDYEPEVRLKNTVLLVNFLMNRVGVRDRNNDLNHQNDLVAFINENYRNWTYEEIKLAFDYYNMGKLEEGNKKMTPLPLLSSSVFGRVLSAYDELKRRSLGKYYEMQGNALREAQMSFEDKKKIVVTGRMELWGRFKKTMECPPGYSMTYDFLRRRGYLKLSDKERKDIMEEAKATIHKRIKEEYGAFKLDLVINSNDNSRYISEAKRIALERWLMEQTDDSIEEIFNDYTPEDAEAKSRK